MQSLIETQLIKNTYESGDDSGEGGRDMVERGRENMVVVRIGKYGGRGGEFGGRRGKNMVMEVCRGKVVGRRGLVWG